MEKIVQAMIDLQVGLLNNAGVSTQQYISCINRLNEIKSILKVNPPYFNGRLNQALLGDKEWNE